MVPIGKEKEELAGPIIEMRPGLIRPSMPRHWSCFNRIPELRRLESYRKDWRPVELEWVNDGSWKVQPARVYMMSSDEMSWTCVDRFWMNDMKNMKRDVDRFDGIETERGCGCWRWLSLCFLSVYVVLSGFWREEHDLIKRVVGWLGWWWRRWLCRW